MKTVFLSFAYEDIQQVKGLLPLLSGPDYDLDFYDGSLDMDIDNKGADIIKRAIGEKISRCKITVCLVADNTYKNKWVECELQKSYQKGNKIIAMALKGIESAKLPDLIREENLRFYPWNPQKLRELIAETFTRLPNSPPYLENTKDF